MVRLAADQRHITTAFYSQDPDTWDDLADEGTALEPRTTEAEKVEAMRRAIAVLGESMDPAATEAESILRRALGETNRR